MYTSVTRDIRVTVTPRFLERESQPARNHFVWAYTVEIVNDGPAAVQLVSRKWRIVDEAGHVQDVSGPGVVGEQPVLEPGGSYTYTSGVPLTTPSGFMGGSYGMTTQEGEVFEAQIPAFSLDSSENGRIMH